MAGHGPRGWVKIVRNWSSDLGQDRENRVGQDREKPWVKIVGNDRLPRCCCPQPRRPVGSKPSEGVSP
jgi:hypothetical protein